MRILFKDSPFHSQRQYQKPVWIYPAHLAMFATHLRNQGNEVVWLGKDDGRFDRIVESDRQIDVDYEKLPIPDRVFTNSMNPKYLKYGNYKMSRGTHLLSSNLCWYGRCSFCVDTERLQAGEHRGVRSPDHVLSEVDDCIRIGHNEIFDDAGTLPIGDWLTEFCTKMIKSGRNKKIMLGCNMKPISEKVVPFKLMHEAGFRFILVGVESANQKTIDLIKKGQESHNVVKNMKAMNDAGLEVHLTSMFGYPWETHEDNMRTVNEIHHLLLKGYVKTAQASVFMPPRTAPPANADAQKYIQKVYDIYKDPRYWVRKVMDIKRWEDVTYLLKRLGHMKHAE